MASERNRVKGDVNASLAATSEPAELSSILSSAHAFKRELATRKEENRHAEYHEGRRSPPQLRNRSVPSAAFGNSSALSQCTIAIASIAVVAGLLFALYCFHAAAYAQHPEAWFHEAEWAGTLAATFLSFIFGRVGRR